MSGSMKSSLARRIFSSVPRAARLRRRSTRYGIPIVESLEDRQLLSALPANVATTPVSTKKPVVPTSAAKLAAPATLAPLNQTFLLNSRPSATKTIYLDFNGHTTSGTSWNAQFTNGADFTTPPYSLDADPNFSNLELIEIQQIWQRVVEDFAPFDVNVTTQDPGVANLKNSGPGDTRWGIRVAIGGTNADWLNFPAGGIANIDGFGSAQFATEEPCFAFSTTQGNDQQVIVETISHEAGHTLGLLHDASTSSPGYYGGHGTFPMTWGPIMGASFGINITQWSKGEYPGATNLEDDLAIITSQNGFGYRNDDYGNTRQTASQLSGKKAGSVRNISASGVIERNTDQDWLSFQTTGGTVNLSFTGDSLGSNLDIAVSLYDGAGTLLMTVNPALSLNASITATLPAGAYSVMIDGVGYGTLATGYSDYGSLGQYFITGTIPDTSTGNNSGTSVIEGKVLANGTNAPISGVMVYLDLDGNGTFNAAVDRSARTDASGNYRFTSLLAGTYNVYQVVPTGWQQKAAGGLSVFVQIDSTATGQNFINVRPPVLSGLASSVSYKSGSTPVLLASAGKVTDADTTVFNGATLTVGIAANVGAADVLGVRNQGNGAGQVGSFAGVVRFGGVAVGTVSGGIAGSNLVITFNKNATLAIVQAVLRNVVFSSTSTGIRTLSFAIADGTGGVSSTLTNRVNVT